jgi:ribonuclease D
VNVTTKQLEEKGWTEKQLKHLCAWRDAKARVEDTKTAFMIADLEVGRIPRTRRV